MRLIILKICDDFVDQALSCYKMGFLTHFEINLDF